ncbi:MAG: hypothetical protein ACYSTI_11520 [Planctomycetota bacterium]
MPLVNIGLSVAVVGLVVFNIMFLLARVEPPKEIEPAQAEGLKIQVEVVEAPSEKDITEYAAIASRNVFSPNRTEWEVLLGTAGPRTDIELDEALADESGLSLLGVVIAGGVEKALIKGKQDVTFLEEGEKIDGYELSGIEPEVAYMTVDGRTFSLRLYEDLSTLTAESPSVDEEAQGLADWLADSSDPTGPQELQGKYKP